MYYVKKLYLLWNSKNIPLYILLKLSYLLYAFIYINHLLLNLYRQLSLVDYISVVLIWLHNDSTLLTRKNLFFWLNSSGTLSSIKWIFTCNLYFIICSSLYWYRSILISFFYDHFLCFYSKVQSESKFWVWLYIGLFDISFLPLQFYNHPMRFIVFLEMKTLSSEG